VVAGTNRDAIGAIARLLVDARSALFITGSGLSTDSDLPVYRGLPGLEARTREDGKQLEQTLSTAMLARAPMTTWRLLLDMDARVRGVRPNVGHRVLARFEQQLPRCTIVTTNVDRLHQRAGSRNVIEMHGALYDLLCTRCELAVRHERFDRLAMPPTCGTCGDVLRPDMPLFGEAVPADPFTRLQSELDEGFNVVLVIGVREMPPYVARPLLVAKSEGIPTVELAARTSELSDVVDLRIAASPADVLGAIAATYDRLRTRAKSDTSQ